MNGNEIDDPTRLDTINQINISTNSILPTSLVLEIESFLPSTLDKDINHDISNYHFCLVDSILTDLLLEEEAIEDCGEERYIFTGIKEIDLTITCKNCESNLYRNHCSCKYYNYIQEYDDSERNIVIDNSTQIERDNIYIQLINPPTISKPYHSINYTYLQSLL